MSDNPTTIELDTSREVPAGSAMAFVCRTIALRAGAYAPGIHEHVFRDLDRREFGTDVDRLARWFAASSAELYRLGYRLGARRIAFRTGVVANWVEHGQGFRGAVLTTDGSRLHEEIKDDEPHAVGILTATNGKKKKPSLALVDPWPGVEHHVSCDPSGPLEMAHRLRKYAAMRVYLSGYS